MFDLSWLPSVIGTPWVLRGRDRATGWDCLGCAEVTQALALGTPEINSLGIYAEAESDSPANLFASHFTAGLAASPYRRVPDRTPGGIVVFRIGRRPVHCGLYLGDGTFLHASQKADTVISKLDDFDYAHAASDYYTPA